MEQVILYKESCWRCYKNNWLKLERLVFPCFWFPDSFQGLGQVLVNLKMTLWCIVVKKEGRKGNKMLLCVQCFVLEIKWQANKLRVKGERGRESVKESCNSICLNSKQRLSEIACYFFSLLPFTIQHPSANCATSTDLLSYTKKLQRKKEGQMSILDKILGFFHLCKIKCHICFKIMILLCIIGF